MRTILAITAVLLFIACAKERIEPASVSASPEPIAYAKTTCDSLQALVDSLQSDRDEACGWVLSMAKHLDQANQRAANEATTLCEWANIYYAEIYLVRCYARAAMGASTQCPNDYPLTDPLFPPAWCSYEQLPECNW